MYIPRIEILYRMEIFLTVFSFSLAVVYSLGNFQLFLDSTQILILKLMSASSLAAIFLGLIVIGREILSIFRKKYRLRLVTVLTTFLFLLLSSVLLLAAHVLLKLSSGFSP